MPENLVQIADGSWHPQDFTSVCSICHKIKLLDDAKDRGSGDCICFECALENDINFCRVCGKAIPLYGGSKERLKCSKCTFKKTYEQSFREKELRTLRNVFEGIKPKHYSIAIKLVMLGDAQKAGVL